MGVLDITDDDVEKSQKYARVDPGDYITEIIEVKEKLKKGTTDVLMTVATHKLLSNGRGEPTQYAGRQVDYYVVGGFAITWLLAVHPESFPNVEKIKSRMAEARNGGEPVRITSENSVGKKCIFTIANDKDDKGQDRNQVVGARPFVGPSA